tara:strand:- start:1790 stop:2455 length:666 start_codon:yes stop_codon:yes gene_type:complete
MKNKNILIIAPHPDDETISMGGSIDKFIKEKFNVHILIISGHLPPLYSENDFNLTVKEAKKAFKILGVTSYKFLKIPATYVKDFETSKLNLLIFSEIQKLKPDTVFIPFPDRHIDHRIIFDSSVVSVRPNGKFFPKKVLSYETLSETHWNVPGIEPSFNPDYFIDISKNIKKKLSALSSYKSQIKNNPTRSLDAVKSLAVFRGSQNGCKFAEAFKVIRIVE